MILKKLFPSVLSAALFVLTFSNGMAASWKDKTIAPVVNPIFFEDPNITSEVRPFFMYHNIDDDFIAGGGDVQVYALQVRWAVNDRWAILATKDGYIDTDFDDVPALSDEGFADIAVGVKYALIDDEEKNFILTPGLRLELPTGNTDVFQGNGDGEWNLFVSTAKGKGNFHTTANLGVRIPNDFDDETAQLGYGLQFDYYVSRWFIPFVALNGFTVLSEGENALPLKVEGFDLVNFGSPDAQGRTQLVTGVGFRSRLQEKIDLGLAYEFSATKPRGLFDDRFTVDLIFRF